MMRRRTVLRMAAAWLAASALPGVAAGVLAPGALVAVAVFVLAFVQNALGLAGVAVPSMMGMSGLPCRMLFSGLPSPIEPGPL